MANIKCPACGKENLPETEYCGECGVNLQNESFSHRNGDSTKLTSSSLRKSGSSIDRKDENLPMEVHAFLVIERGFSVGTKFYLTADESYIGRWDADNGIFPDIDLDPYDPEAKVSRRHARIIRENGNYSIEDLGSTNGTFVNRGKRLTPGTKHPLANGDEIIVGKTFLRFYIRYREDSEETNVDL
jgi:hypothetical protein